MFPWSGAVSEEPLDTFGGGTVRAVHVGFGWSRWKCSVWIVCAKVVSGGGCVGQGQGQGRGQGQGQLVLVAVPEPEPEPEQELKPTEGAWPGVASGVGWAGLREERPP